MKNILDQIVLIVLGAMFGIAVYGSYQAHTKSYQISTVDPEPAVEYVYIESEPEVITEYIYVEKEPVFYRDMSEDDTYYYSDMAMREAEGEGVVGMLWVMYCMECRCEAYGLTPKEVWESDAFSSSWNRRGIEPNDDCKEALALFEEGWMPKPLWFRRDTYHSFGTPLCQVGKHCFSMR